MSEPIKVGYLVVVVRWPCCGAQLGTVGRVKEIKQYHLDGMCAICGCWSVITGPFSYVVTEGGGFAPLSWLKRIPPLEELEGQPTQEDIKEPA